MKDKNKLGIKFKRLRIQKKFTQEDVASMCEISLYDLIDIEKGNTHPSDMVYKQLLKLYGKSESQFLREDFIDHKKRVSIINYVQIVISFLLILGYLLPFTYHYYGPEEVIVTDQPGFMLLFNGLYGYPWVVSIVFLVFVVQFGLHIGLYLKKKRVSNIFKIIFLMMNFTSIILFYLDVHWNHNMLESTMWVFIALLSVHIVITFVDLIKYPLNHDTKADLNKMRKLFVLLMMIVFLGIYIVLLNDVFTSSFEVGIAGIAFYAMFGIYLVSYIFIRKAFLETRRNVSIFISIPAVAFFILNMISLIIGEMNMSDMIQGQILMILMLFLPLFVVNIDYFIELIRNFFTKGDSNQITNKEVK